QRRLNPSLKENGEQAKHHERSQQAELFRSDSENEVGVRLGQIEQFLLAFHQSHAVEPARAYGDERLNNVKAASLRIGGGIQECKYAVRAPGHAEDQKVQRQNRGGNRVPKITYVHAGHIKHGGGDGDAGNRGAQVRLLHDQSSEQNRGNGRGNQRVTPVVHL